MEDSQVKPRILIVEDDPDQCQLICDSLCVYYDNAEDIVRTGTAAQCLEQDLEHFDILLLDYNLPDMEGFALIEKIHEQSDVPIIVITGETDSAIAAAAVKNGAMDYVVKLGDYLFTIPAIIEKNLHLYAIKKENKRLNLEMKSMVDELRVKNLKLEESMEQLRKVATTDHLTGLANRRKLMEIIERNFSEAIRYGFDLTCCMCDLDHYKQINDLLGHKVGDDILVITADVIRSSLRGSDLAARYGGDEFVLVLPHTSLERGLAVSERIRQDLFSRTRDYQKLSAPVTLSIGVASIGEDNPTSAQALLSMADKALYTAKDLGKDHITAFSKISQMAKV